MGARIVYEIMTAKHDGRVVAPTLEQTIRMRHKAGLSQRAVARELDIDRRKIERILDQTV